VTARQHLMARGALYFTSVGAALNLKHRTSRGIDGVVRELFALTRSRGRPLTLADWLEVVRARLGTDGERAYRRSIEEGEIPPLASAALGPCFRLGTRRYAEFVLGFDLAQTRASDLRVIAGLDPKGPAARAGLRATDRLVTTRFRENQPDAPVQVDVLRGDERVTIRYLPQGRSQVGPAWLRRQETPDAECQY
jgi:predicted metalloprotease with PDZ domain